MKSAFDRDYYQRFYYDPRTAVVSRAEMNARAKLIAAYAGHIGLPVRRMLDAGCGIGLLRAPLQRALPRAIYVGLEYSEYLCERYGWEQGSVVDYASRTPFDLVICQGVLPYLDARSAKRAIDNLGALCRGALYLEAVTREDWDGGVLDKRRTDRAMQLRRASWYRRALAPHFIAAGGGVWVSRRAKVALYALEGAP